MGNETTNGPENVGRKITYFLGLLSDPRTHAVLGHIHDLKKHEGYAPHTLFFEAISYGNLEELSDYVNKFVDDTNKPHFVYVCDCATVSYLKPSATADHGCVWKVELGTKAQPANTTNSKRTDRQLGIAKFLLGIFVKNIDEQLSREQLPWGTRPYTHTQRKEARLKRQGKPIKVPCHPGRWNTHRHAWDDHYDCTPGTQAA